MTLMARDYALYDVFTDRPLAGNPLAVVFDAEGLGDAEMQTIAREFNLSETVFVFGAGNLAHTARLRIFTPGRELPFAGHPTVGAAVALAERAHPGQEIDLVSVLEETVGPVRCAVRMLPGKASFAEFDLPRQSERVEVSVDRDLIADALQISAADIGFENHAMSAWSAGVPFLMVPVRDLGVAESIVFNAALWVKAFGQPADRMLPAFVYCRGGVHHAAQFHARMFAPDMGIAEDPATGAAVAAMSGAIRHFDRLSDGHHALLIEQGVEMGRPSHIHLHIEVATGKIGRARIGGEAVAIASGKLHL
jgi:trans-2,3-dihydro-3-hydroxyanthranilate isomerase